MASMVDSKQTKISVGQIMLIAAESLDEFKKYGKSVVMPAIMTEMNQPNTQSKQFGNTLFIVHLGDDGTAYFKALNADTAKNYLENSYAFVDWAKNELGLHTLVTSFTDKSILHIFKMISTNPPFPDMGYQAFNTEDGSFCVYLNLGGGV